MKKERPYSVYLILGILIGIIAIGLYLSNKGIGGLAVEPGSSCPKLSQASLDVETKGCPSTFDSPFSEERTSWKIEKSADTESPLINTLQNQIDEISYTVKVTEGKTVHVLIISGQLIITNGGQQTPGLTSVTANLQTKIGGSKFTTKASAIAVAADLCRQQQKSPTCFGTFTNSPGASLKISDKEGNDVSALLGNVLIPQTQDFDDDNDGRLAEDCIEQSGEQIDNDHDGLLNEDCFNTCPNAVKINYVAEFNMDQQGLLPGQQVRLEMLTTFLGAGARGGSPETVSCSIDADCNGVINKDNPATCNLNEDESNNVRTVPTRKSFVVPSFTPVCASVLKEDNGTLSEDNNCAHAESNSLSSLIQKQFEGAVNIEKVLGTVACAVNSCQTTINNKATLVCADGRNELIEGSPAVAGIAKICQIEEENKLKPGDFCTFTQGGWGAECNGNNPGCFRNNYFNSVFPTGVGIGQGVSCILGVCGQSPILNGVPLFAAKWTNSIAVQNYLPAKGKAEALSADLQNPVATSSGVLDGQLLSATLAVAYDDAGKFDIGAPFIKNRLSKKIGDLVYQGGTPCDGLTVRQMLNEAHKFTSGAVSSLTANDLNTCLSLFNEGFDNCLVADNIHFNLGITV
jgi:hypothetical protein